MGRFLYPDLVLPSIGALDQAVLRSRGIRGIIVDLDNTIARRDRETLDEPAAGKLRELLAEGFRLAVVSNNGSARTAAVAAQAGIPFVAPAVKPFAAAFRRAMRLSGTSPAETAVVGDQIFTDVLGGNLLGLFTILVRPLPGKECIATRLISRPLEKVVLARLAARGRVGP